MFNITNILVITYYLKFFYIFKKKKNNIHVLCS